ncbi:hypothetical protein [Paenibacillus sp. OV219]|uniref:hypothetical protein n=1 Tax=Paenibacillus sp. OV219 TaxID=1884377 RepID=UPI0008C5299A|nr:hypothetical protein [Paenibacillus sp. OV219]SEN33043.1 hypothetical protein SAMN05518847_102691 [Paenibacillus sp. OV219]
MPYRPIDFQVSIPRTPDQGVLQNQLNHRAHADQARLENDTSKQTELARSRNTAVEQSSEPQIKNNRQRDHQSPSKQKKQNQQAEGAEGSDQGPEESQHPYKGKHIDISL